MESEAASCYGGGDIFKTILITLVVLVLLEIGAYFFYTKYWKNRKGPRLVVNDKEAQKDEYAFDNPGFHNETAAKESKNKSLLETKWLPIGTLLKQDKRRTVDDSSPVDFPIRAVPLKGRDFTGLGFDIRGGLRDGIYVDSLRQSGPAHQSGKIQPGDKLRSIRIDFDHVALQDALNILGAAAPYDVLLEVQQQHPQQQLFNESPGNMRAGRSSGGRPEHPLYRAYSSGDVTKVNTLKKNTADSGFDEFSPVKLDKASAYKLTPKSSNSSSTVERNGNAMYAIENEKKQTRADNHKPEVIKRHNLEDDKTQKDIENDNKKGLKFGIRVLPPNVNDKLFGKSSKPEVDNKESMAAEMNGDDQSVRPAPAVKRRHKEYKEVPSALNNNTELSQKEQTNNFIRQGSANSSGIKRDSAGIPQELPDHMLQAAMAARTNRKNSADVLREKEKDNSDCNPEPYESEMNLKELKEQFMKGQSTFKAPIMENDKPNFEFVNVKNRNGKDADVHVKSSDDENTIKSTKKSKGKAPLPPEIKKPEVKHVLEFKNMNNTDTDMDISTETMNTNLSVDVTDTVAEDDSTLHQILDLDLIENVPDNKTSKPVNELLNRCDDSIILSDRPSTSSTPKSTKRQMNQNEENETSEVSATEENSKEKEELSDSDVEVQNISPSGTTIELNSSHITIHHMSPTEGMDNETRKTASLGDLSRLNNVSQKISTANGTLERAQSLDISDQNEQVLTPKKRKAQNGPQDMYTGLNMNEEHNTSSKEPKLMSNLGMQISALDGPNNFHINRLKKSTEWGNLEDISQISTPSSTPSDNDLTVQKTETNYMTKNPDASKFHFRFSDTPPFVLNTNKKVNDLDVDNMQIYETNISDDIKVSRHSFNSLERPRSELLTMVSNFNTDSQTNQIDEIKFSQPVSLTYVQDEPLYEINVHTTNMSPTFTSDIKGVNNISISTKETDKKEENEQQSNENIMTIVTTDSQPSSIICIESESSSLNKINYNDVNDTNESSPIIEGAKLEQNGTLEIVSESINSLNTLPVIIQDDPTTINQTTYITEIEVMTPYNKDNDTKKMEKVDETKPVPKTAIYQFKSINNPDSDLDIYELKSNETTNDGSVNNITKPKFEYAKNAEIKFSTSTYEQPKSEKRLSQIEFLRSNFEKNAELFKSNIPKPTTSPTKNNTSPSKIPVFNSTKITEVSKLPPKQAVSITAIKSSSRNPSGK